MKYDKATKTLDCEDRMPEKEVAKSEAKYVG